MKRQPKEPSDRQPTRGRRVLRIARYRQRYEVRDKWRRQMPGPLEWAKDYVGTNAGHEAAKYQQQLTMLGDGPRAALRFGLFRLLVGMASNQDRPYRGYLLDANCEPLSDVGLAKLLRWDLAELRPELKALLAAGLIERVVEPDYIQEDEASLPPEEDENPTGGDSEDRKPPVRRSARECAQVRSHSRTGNEQRSTHKKTGSKSATPKASPTATKNTTPCPPTTLETVNPKTNPQESAAAGVSANPPCAPPRPALPADQPQPIGRLLPGVIAKIGQREKWTDEEAVRFGYEVFAGIWPGDDPETERGKSERGAFTAWLHKQTGDRQAAAEKGLRIARHVGKNRKSYRRPGAVWRDIVDGKSTGGLKVRAG